MKGYLLMNIADLHSDRSSTPRKTTLTINKDQKTRTRLTRWGVYHDDQRGAHSAQNKETCTFLGVCTPTRFFSTVIPNSSKAFSLSLCTSCVLAIFSSHVSFRLCIS